MSIAIVADADTLFSASTRGLLIYLDYQGLVSLHWSPMILDEVNRALVATGRKPTLAAAQEHAARMCNALPHAMVAAQDVQAQFQTVAPAVRSAKDIHVAACAYYLIAANAYPGTSPVPLLTLNTRDFKTDRLASLGISLMKPDSFLDSLVTRHPQELAQALRLFRLDLASRPTPQALLDRLERDGLQKTAQRLLALWQRGVLEL